jgi:lipopolysaccharide transport system permease protein
LPKLIFPTVFILTDTLKTIIVALIVCLVLFATGFYPNQAYLALPLLFLTQFLMIMATGYFLSAIVPFFPDLNILVTLLLRMLWFLSGVFFDPQNISAAKRELFFLNPMARLINDYRGVLMHQRWPDITPLLWISMISILLIISTTGFIKRHDTVYPRIVTQ